MLIGIAPTKHEETHGQSSPFARTGLVGRTFRFVLPQNRTLNRAAPNYKNSHPLVVTLRISLYPDTTLGERIKKWRLEQGLFQRDLVKMVGMNEMTIVNWENGRTKPTRKNLGKIGGSV
jgi:DNA-binding XRE family transcriptional regulator